MTDASAVGRELARRRWGSTRLDSLLAELSLRSDQLDPTHRAALAELAEPPQPKDTEERR